jgi:diguanylate cyclase (GGDEF)-like protein
VRSYKRALSHDEAMDILRKDVGTMFDPAVFAAFETVQAEWAPRTAEMQRDASVELMAGPDALPLPAGHDPLTRLPLAPLVHAEIARLLDARGSRSLAVLVVRVDTSAALAARAPVAPAALDELRRRVADTLCRNTRGGDYVARLGDDEFAVLLPDAQPNEARAVADRLRDATAAVLAPPGAMPRRGVHALATIGVAVSPGQGHTADALLRAARDARAAAVGDRVGGGAAA